MIYKWSSSEKSAGYIGKSECDDKKVKWYNQILGTPLISLDDWSPPLLVQFLGKESTRLKELNPVTDSVSSSLVHIISQRAVDELKDIWLRHALLYPVKLEDRKGENFYMVVVNTVLDCLDREKSRGPLNKYGSKRGLFAYVEEWVFDEDCLGDADLFVIPDSATITYVSDRFKQRVIDAELKSFCLKTHYWEDESK